MKITLSKKQWQFIGQKTGWIKTAQYTPEQEKERTKAFNSMDNLNVETTEWDRREEKEEVLRGPDSVPTGRTIYTQDYEMEVSGTIYYPDFMQELYGSVEEFVSKFTDFWDIYLEQEKKIRNVNWNTFNTKKFESKKIDDKNYEIEATYLFSTEQII